MAHKEAKAIQTIKVFLLRKNAEKPEQSGYWDTKSTNMCSTNQKQINKQAKIIDGR